ncbi:hypothetical protein PV516_18880 [Streptomyces scabiei]|uniref:hypothetical protein n=1 Tax=Streptomyces scabiei TaxID=1930 RepID=UPI0029B93B4F|nr:hypothetical protein [Streptomyces scabiei]MDX3165852.1 hypothetical protein [Streptomyces scabiei]
MADTYEANWNDGNQDIAESVIWAADERKPLIVTTHKGETVRMVPEATTETKSETPAALEGVLVWPVAQEYKRVLRVSGTPDLADRYGVSITPETVWLEYRQEQGETARLVKAYVLGYRVQRTDGPDDFKSIELTPTIDDLPDWLTALAAVHAPA